ncbi:coniferyl aldehyde dehydrogenase [Halomonas sp. 328]|uniref:coniferyl aldehyde dehydrogenase n=1 Tax=Halomonas sp. 328 TaxID=2776704 RepID=UPI0018A7868D|nr:coniferyl aldehyde dehydrogenase [Halomonas sp. 328]MBF8221079.1 coniferyl aldehyde dehydrogenase [Halomonas sp. 328]
MDAALPTTDAAAIARLERCFAAQRRAFAADPMPSAERRRADLSRLEAALVRHQDTLCEAIARDFGHRSHDETRLAELLPSLEGIRFTRRRLKGWMRPARRRVGLPFQPAGARVVYQPLGVVGIMVPWNYPLFLAIGPLVSALAAGNRALIKISEATPASGEALRRVLAEAFDERQVAVVGGQVAVAEAFAALPFDHLLFTGSTAVGRRVMQAAAANLTPVTLELGGKSPALIGDGASMAHTAERLAFGKGLNAGQTCVAPDYVLCPRDRVAALVEALTSQVRRQLPSLADNPDATWIINAPHYDRLRALLDDAEAKGARAVPLLDADALPAGARLMAPTLLLEVNDEMRVMQEEIFGPLLPILPYDTLEQALAYLAERPRPLALYYFGTDGAEQRRVIEGSHAGGMCLNDCVMQVAQDDLPFGGIGASGMGHYHGREGFLTFSHAKGIYHKGQFNAARLIYPPYGGRLLKWLYRWWLR